MTTGSYCQGDNSTLANSPGRSCGVFIVNKVRHEEEKKELQESWTRHRREIKELQESWRRHRREIKLLQKDKEGTLQEFEEYKRTSISLQEEQRGVIEKNQLTINCLQESITMSFNSVRKIVEKFGKLSKSLQSNDPDAALAEKYSNLGKSTPKEKSSNGNWTQERQEEFISQIKMLEDSLEAATQEILDLKQDMAHSSSEFKDLLSQRDTFGEALKKSKQQEERLNLEIKKLGKALSAERQELRSSEKNFIVVSQQLESTQNRKDEELALETERLNAALGREQTLIKKRMRDTEYITELVTSLDNMENQLLQEKKRNEKLEFRLEMQKRISWNREVESSQDKYEKLINDTRCELECTRRVLEKKKKVSRSRGVLIETIGSMCESDDVPNPQHFEFETKLDVGCLISLISDIEAELRETKEKTESVPIAKSPISPEDMTESEFETQLLKQLSQNEQALRLLKEAGDRVAIVTREFNLVESVTNDSFKIVRALEKCVRAKSESFKYRLQSTEKQRDDLEAELRTSKKYASQLETALKDKEELIVALQNAIQKLEEENLATVQSADVALDKIKKAVHGEEIARTQVRELTEQLRIQKSILEETRTQFQEQRLMRLQILEQLLEETKKSETDLCTGFSKSTLELMSALRQVLSGPFQPKENNEEIFEIYVDALRKAQSLLCNTWLLTTAFNSKLESLLAEDQ